MKKAITTILTYIWGAFMLSLMAHMSILALYWTWGFLKFFFSSYIATIGKIFSFFANLF